MPIDCFVPTNVQNPIWTEKDNRGVSCCATWIPSEQNGREKSPTEKTMKHELIILH